MYFKLALILLIGIISCQPAVLTASLNHTEFVQALRPMLTTSLLNSLNQSQVESMEFEDGQMHADGFFSNNQFNILESQPTTTFKAVTDQESLMVTVNGITAQFYSDYYQYNHKIFVANGTFSIEMKNISVSYVVNIAQNDVKDKTMPLFEVSDIKINIPKPNMAYVVHSNLVQEMIEQLKDIFIDNFYKEFVSNITQSVSKSFPSKLNRALQNQNGSSQVQPNMFFDWNVVKFPKIQNDWINVGFNGQIHKKNQTLSEISTAIELPYQSSHSKSNLHIFAANEFFESGLKTHYQLNPVRIPLQPSQLVQASQKKQFDTTTLNAELPGITKKYGANLPIDILIENMTMSNVAIVPNNQFTAKLSYNLKFQINPREAAATLKLTMNSNFQLTVENSEWVQVIMKNLTIDSIEVVSSSIGLTNLTLVQKLLSNLNPLIIAAFNDRKEQLPLPSMLGGLFKIKQISLESSNGYLHFSVDTIFVMPTSDVASIGYQQWVPTPKISALKNEIYEEELDCNGKHSQVIIRNYNFFELFRNQINIFRHIPQLFK